MFSVIILGILSTVRSEKTMHCGTCKKTSGPFETVCPHCSQLVYTEGYVGPGTTYLCPSCGGSSD